MIGARSLHDSQWDGWNLAEDHSLLSIYGDKRMHRNKNIQRVGSDVEQNHLIVDKDGDFRIQQHDLDENETRRDKSRVKRDSKYKKEDPRHVAVSWYSYFYIRPDSPTQWTQRDDADKEPDHLRIMGFESDPDARRYHPPPVKSDMSVLEKLSKMAEYGEMGDAADMEVEGILEENRYLLSKTGDGMIIQSERGSITKAPGYLTETREFLSELRRQSPLI